MLDIPVLISGGGPVGLAASLLLSQHGVPSLLVERHPSTAITPKATTDAIAPAFLFLAVCELAALVAIVAYRKEPHGKPIDIE